jgi:hypothetical protein
MKQVLNLPFGIKVTRAENGGASIESNLRSELLINDRPEEQFTAEDQKAAGFIDGIESLLVGLASNGLALAEPIVAGAVEAAVEAFVNTVL